MQFIAHGVWSLVVVIALITGLSPNGAMADDNFDEAFRAAAEQICLDPVPPRSANFPCDSPIVLTDEIFTMDSRSPGTGASSAPQSNEEAVRRRLISETGDSGRGGGDEWAADLGNGLAVFISSGVYYVGHDRNRFERGYDSVVPTVTGGLDWRVSDEFIIGVAFNYLHQDAAFTNGPGGFKTHSYGPSIYLGFRPFDNAFANLVLGYTHEDNSFNRSVIITNTGVLLFNGATKGETDTDNFSASLTTGYDHLMGAITVGPRFGLTVATKHVDGYSETGTTGLELNYQGYTRTSVQSSLGAAASTTTDASFGPLTAELLVAWVHEYAYDQEIINASFVLAPGAPFAFSTEKTARDWATVNLGISTVLDSGIRPYLNFNAVFANRNYEVYGGTIGFYVPL